MGGPVDVVIAALCRGQSSVGADHSGGICRDTRLGVTGFGWIVKMFDTFNVAKIACFLSILQYNSSHGALYFVPLLYLLLTSAWVTQVPFMEHLSYIKRTLTACSLSIQVLCLSYAVLQHWLRYILFVQRCVDTEDNAWYIDLFTSFLLLDEAVASRAVFVIVSGSAGRADGRKRFWSQPNN